MATDAGKLTRTRFESGAWQEARDVLRRAPSPRLRVEPHSVRRIAARRDNIRPAVAVQIPDRDAIHIAPAIVPPDLAKIDPASVIQENRSSCLDISDHDIQPPVTIQICYRDRVRNALLRREQYWLAKLSLAMIEINE